ncbi:Serine/threonine protein phosphatase [Frankia canadensis]|uniref:Serine/threonine protein phosphatase n=1 Tax=Frankia canadensis TaxID=1836972 RepID=A0A2I2KNV9_9ACTN|nr:PP2C family protein-serine/threonine phosphatase [Frankia canadensis]SNQ47336.1 Serine/threonine protein phosphatase [Frankia canadensis]SOU54626.1 Serine/threonine protein phosphatase [Frankia canadensis]
MRTARTSTANLRLIIAGAAVLLVTLIVDLGPGVALTGYFGLGPLILAAACSPWITAAIGAVTVAVGICSGLWDDRFGSGQHIAAVVLVLIQSVIAVYICVYRDRQRSKLHRVQAVAEVAQRALLPAVPNRLDGAGFAARYLSAAEEASVGGDLYEVVPTASSIRVIIGDVRGKGLPAVRLASVVLGAFREAAVTWLDPEQVAAACARAVLREAGPEDFVTALVLDIHPDGRLGMCSAGHHPPRLVSPDSARTVQLRSPSPPLGLAERFTTTTDHWAVGDRLLLFTDGLIEARDRQGSFFPLDERLDLLRGGGQEEALDRLTAALGTHAGGALHDDLAVLLAERRTPSAPPVPAPPVARVAVD